MARKVSKIDNSYNKYSPEVVARPVDTYVTPARDTGRSSEYRSLAGALAGLHDPLAKYAAKREQEREQAGLAEGQQLYNQNPDRLSWEDYVKQNPSIPVNQHMKRGYLMARASNEADIIKNAMYQAYSDGSAVVEINGQQVNIAESDNPAAFDAWVRGFTNKFITENMGDDVDPEIYAGILMPQVEESVKALTNTHINRRNEVLVGKTVREYGRLMQNVIRDTVTEDGEFDLGGVEGSVELAGRISVLYKDMLRRNVPPAMANEALLDSLIKAAGDDRVRDMERILEVGRNIELPDGTLIGDDPTMALKLQNAIESEEIRREQEEERDRVRQKREQQDAIEARGVSILQEALRGKRISRATLLEYTTMPGISDEDVSGMVSKINVINDGYNKPTGMSAAEKAAQKEKSAQAELAFYRFLTNNPGLSVKEREDAIMASDMDTDDKVRNMQSLHGDAEAIDKAYRETLDKQVPEILRTQAFKSNKELDAENTTLMQASVATVIEAVNKRIGTNMELKRQPNLVIGIAIDEANKRAIEIERSLPVVQEETKKGTSANDYGTFAKAGQDKALAELNAPDLTALLKTHNDFAAEGYDVTNSSFINTLNRLGFSVADYEKTTGRKVLQNRTAQSRKELKPRQK